MVGRVIRKPGAPVCEYPRTPEDVEQSGQSGRLKIALATGPLSGMSASTGMWCIPARKRGSFFTPSSRPFPGRYGR